MKAFKSIITLSVLFITVFSSAQQNAITFSYDAGGNMIERKLQVSPGARFSQATNAKDTSMAVNFKIYPNPTNTDLTLEGTLPDDVRDAQVTMFNVNGQTVKKDNYRGQKKTINVADLKSGMYLLEIRYSEREKETYKIIITN